MHVCTQIRWTCTYIFTYIHMYIYKHIYIYINTVCEETLGLLHVTKTHQMFALSFYSSRSRFFSSYVFMCTLYVHAMYIYIYVIYIIYIIYINYIIYIIYNIYIIYILYYIILYCIILYYIISIYTRYIYIYETRLVIAVGVWV